MQRKRPTEDPPTRSLHSRKPRGSPEGIPIAPAPDRTAAHAIVGNARVLWRLALLLVHP
jgi:hypothetical protein